MRTDHPHVAGPRNRFGRRFGNCFFFGLRLHDLRCVLGKKAREFVVGEADDADRLKSSASKGGQFLGQQFIVPPGVERQLVVRETYARR